MARRHARRPRGEHGFTATEVILVVVMLGLIGGPLLAALFQTFKTMPEARERTLASVDRVLLADTYARDIANAQTVTREAFADVELWRGNAYCAPGITWPILTTTWDDGPTRDIAVRVSYAVTVVQVGSPNTYGKFTLVRTQKNGSDDASTKALAEGFCNVGDIPNRPAEVTIDTTGSSERVRMRLQVRTIAGGPIDLLEFEGSVRRTATS